MRDRGDQMVGMMNGSEGKINDTNMPIMPRYKEGGTVCKKAGGSIDGKDFTGGSSKESSSKPQNASEKMKMKKGGHACFAAGGVAKIRHGQSDMSGCQKKMMPKGSRKS